MTTSILSRRSDSSCILQKSVVILRGDCSRGSVSTASGLLNTIWGWRVILGDIKSSLFGSNSAAEAKTTYTKALKLVWPLYCFKHCASVIPSRNSLFRKTSSSLIANAR